MPSQEPEERHRRGQRNGKSHILGDPESRLTAFDALPFRSKYRIARIDNALDTLLAVLNYIEIRSAEHVYLPHGLQKLEVLVRIQPKTNSVVGPRQPAKVRIQ